MDTVTPKLSSIFQITTDWLKFAEAKNAVLLAFSGAGITATITYLSAASNAPNSLRVGFIVSTILLSLSSITCAISFLPKTNPEHVIWLRGNPARKLRKLQDNSDNLYYFGHIQKYSSDELLDSLNRFYFENAIPLPYKKEYMDISSQIVANSEIASIKFKLFTIALWFLIFSFLSIPAILAVSLVVNHSL